MPMLTETIEKTFALDFNLDVIAEDAYKDHILIMNFLEKRDAEGIKSAVTIHLHHAFLTEQLNLQWCRRYDTVLIAVDTGMGAVRL